MSDDYNYPEGHSCICQCYKCGMAFRRQMAKSMTKSVEQYKKYLKDRGLNHVRLK